MLVLVLFLAACSQADQPGLRKRAVEFLSKRAHAAVTDLPERCGPGSALAGVKHCVLPDAERDGIRRVVQQDYVALVQDFFEQSRARRDDWAKLIVEQPERADALLAAIADAYAGCKTDCDDPEYIRAANAQLEDALVAALSSALGDVPASNAAATWLDPKAFVMVYRISDDNLLRAKVMSADSIMLRHALDQNLSTH